MTIEAPHLDMAELLAVVHGDPGTEDDPATDDMMPARSHLAACRGCREEARRWGAVSDGVRLLVAATDVPPWQPGLLDRRGAGGIRRRRVLVAAAAAGILAAGGTSWGLAASGSAGSPAGTDGHAGLTAVTGCPGLDITSGTLQQVTGTTLILHTRDGQQVTVTTSASTTLSTEVPGSVSDIADGAHVIVRGAADGETVTARNVGVNLVPGPPPGGTVHLRATVRPGFAIGTVTDARAGGFTVIDRLGRHVPVTTSGATAVETLAPVSLSQLRTGERTLAVGHPGPGGSLTAATVEQGPSVPMVQWLPGHMQPGVGCSSSAVATAVLLPAS